MRLVNLTPHAITIVTADDRRVEIPASGQVARVTVQSVRLDEGSCFEIEGIGRCSFDLSTETLGNPVGLPEAQPDTYLIVSRMVFDHPALKSRTDLLCPDTGRAVREDGKIIGVPGFLVHP